MKYLQSVLIIIIIIAISSCRKDFSTVSSFGRLEFSKDTVFLDTIFTNIGSSTYNLKVYNRSDQAISIPEIRLENGPTSNYRLNVDGIPGKTFQDVEILAQDSIFVFIETTIDFNQVPDPLYTDKILFDNGTNQQDVDLVTLVQDATFIFPGRDPITLEIDNLSLDGQSTTTQGRFLEDSELTFTKDKPYVIYGYAAVPANKTLTIEAGAKLHFHSNSGLIIDREATLKVNGTLDEKVSFEGDRLEQGFDNVPGQWGTIWMRAGSRDNEINHSIIKNGVVGVLVDSIGSDTTPTLKIQNSEIYNQSSFGILGREANIEGNNLVIGDAGQVSFAGTVGGTYNLDHCTFANYWSNSLRTLPAVLINNFFTFQNAQGQNIIGTADLKAANFTNCIIYGNNNIEFVLDRAVGSSFNYMIENCLIQFDDFNGSFANNNELNFTDTTHYLNNIINQNPDFKTPFEEDFRIGANSPAINKAKASPISLDILGVSRTAAPDIGAYQHITFN
ncbi:choice-of-anchor Q domain-containing protein [Tenacibaculum amylolyticum]|uniref:choice-of-anchor Q domain-containing protein n=1 Tax=Tenacibaculum amylolyticum TaxID=104269 RepID=UPI0038933924